MFSIRTNFSREQTNGLENTFSLLTLLFLAKFNSLQYIYIYTPNIKQSYFFREIFHCRWLLKFQERSAVAVFCVLYFDFALTTRVRIFPSKILNWRKLYSDMNASCIVDTNIYDHRGIYAKMVDIHSQLTHTHKSVNGVIYNCLLFGLRLTFSVTFMKGEWNYFVMDSRIFPGYVAVGCLLVYFSGVAMRRLLSIIIIITTERKITAIMERFHNKWNRCHDMARDTNTQTTAWWTNIYTMQWPHSKPHTHTHQILCIGKPHAPFRIWIFVVVVRCVTRARDHLE